jgi:16S rRNA (uracil1498-N3)-methyltransferase
MPLPYFYEPTISTNKNFILSEDTSRHCIQVLRMKENEQLQLTNGVGKLFTSVIIKAHKQNCEVEIQDIIYEDETPKKICVAISLLKNNNRFEWFLEKATEIGVKEFIPMLCSRTEKQQFRFERMNNILISAMLQSRQMWLPKLNLPTTFNEVVNTSSCSKKLIAHCMNDSGKILLKDSIVDENAQILIGPEGDFSDEEIKTALKQHYIPVTLGSTRLRTETAGVVASALLVNNNL